MNNNDSNPLWSMGLQTIKALESDRGIFASSRNEAYGCIFGRDSLITLLKLLRAYEKVQDPYFLSLAKKILINLAELQGTQLNIESGEQPGKIIHEYRPDKHERLTKHHTPPWFVYPDGGMRNYDSVDSTPLFLIAVHRYIELTNDTAFTELILPSVYNALDWLVVYGDNNHDKFIDYLFHPARKYGGLTTQSWMDSGASVFHEDFTPVSYPIAPVEVQAYTYTALRAWAKFFETVNEEHTRLYNARADQLKTEFNQKFVVQNPDGTFHLAAAIDGKGKPMTSVRSSMGHCLWSVWQFGGEKDTIVEARYIPNIVDRLMQPDMFEPAAGIRTLSTKSSAYDPHSYHNGSIWPHDSSIIAEGLENFGYVKQAAQIRQAIHTAITHFNTPIELFVYENGEYGEYSDSNGHRGCKEQAWSASSLLA